MMREILFRGKRLDNGKWVGGNLFVSDTDGGTYKLVGSRIVTIEWEVDPSTIGQYTGLHDGTKWEELSPQEQAKFLKEHKKEEWCGKPIFEGDIVDLSSNPGNGYGNVEVVFFDNGGFAPFSIHGWECTPDPKKSRVVGNVYDNPSLVPRWWRR